LGDSSSTSSVSRVDDIGSWSEYIKHDILRRYIPARRTVLHSRRHQFPGGDHYVDGFAGAGIAWLRGEDRLVDGSPRIALDVPQPFDHYWFFEQTGWRADRLRALTREYPDRRIEVLEGDCNRLIVEHVVPLVRAEYGARGFALLDPFTSNLDWVTVEALARTRAFEVVVNVPTMVLNRGTLHNDLSGLTPTQVERMTRFWGSDEWLDLLYEDRPGLWGETRRVKTRPTTAERLGRLFKERRLARVFEFVSDPLVVRNTVGGPIYCLIFAGPNETGLKIATQVVRKPIQLPMPTPPAEPRCPLPLPFLEAN
jgi:three-Cys-motif partner protein